MRLLLPFLLASCVSAADLVTHAGTGADERFLAVHRLSDGSLLIGGQAADLTWIPGTVPRTTLAITGITSTVTGRTAFLLHVAADGQSILRAAAFPAGTLLDVSRIRSTEVPGSATGALILSGTIEPAGFSDDGKSPGYALVKLNGNFVSAVPSAASWAVAVDAGGDVRSAQPWDVDGTGRVTYVAGKPFVNDWSAIYRLRADGTGDVVANWPAHWTATTEIDAWTAPADAVHSGIVLKAGRAGSLRSTGQADYDLTASDEKGNAGRKGRYPDDYYFSGPLPAGGPGYTGYSATGKTQRCVAVAVDRRDGDTYIGYSTQTTLPGGNPDFEPAVAALTATGSLKWWARLYRETNANSSPDQYVDGLAIDYSTSVPQVVVLGRCHGNNTINFWSHPDGNGFQNGFSGTSGNIHISWLGRLRDDGGAAVLTAATYHAEWAEGATSFAAPLSGANYDGWPGKTGGNANLNTTRATTNTLEVDASGRIYVLAKGRRVLTTADAYQRMAHPARKGRVTVANSNLSFRSDDLIGKGFPQLSAAKVTFGSTTVGLSSFDPATGTVTLATALGAPPVGQSFTLVEGASAWSSFVRVYSADLTGVVYSSLLTGDWNRSDQTGGDNTSLNDVVATPSGLAMVGFRTATSGVANGNAVPTANVPAWGTPTGLGESPLFALLTIGGGGGGAPSGPGTTTSSSSTAGPGGTTAIGTSSSSSSSTGNSSGNGGDGGGGSSCGAGSGIAALLAGLSALAAAAIRPSRRSASAR